MIERMLIAALAGIGLYKSIKKAINADVTIGMCSPEIEEWLHNVHKFKDEHPETDLTDEQIGEMFLPERIKKQNKKKAGATHGNKRK